MPTRGRKGRRKNKVYALTTSAKNANDLSMIVEPWMPLFPAKTVRTLRYAVGHVGLSSTSGVVVSHVLSANGAYDPDVTGTGHQPMGFDQMMAFYNHYCVTHTKLVVRFGTASGNYGVASLRVDASPTPVTDIERIMEFGGNVTVGLEALGAFGANKALELAVDMAKIQGISPAALTADSTLRGDASANPTEQTYFHIQLWNPAGVTVTCNVYAILEMRVMFLEPRSAALSTGDEKTQFTLRPGSSGSCCESSSQINTLVATSVSQHPVNTTSTLSNIRHPRNCARLV